MRDLFSWDRGLKCVTGIYDIAKRLVIVVNLIGSETYLQQNDRLARETPMYLTE